MKNKTLLRSICGIAVATAVLSIGILPVFATELPIMKNIPEEAALAELLEVSPESAETDEEIDEIDETYEEARVIAQASQEKYADELEFLVYANQPEKLLEQYESLGVYENHFSPYFYDANLYISQDMYVKYYPLTESVFLTSDSCYLQHTVDDDDNRYFAEMIDFTGKAFVPSAEYDTVFFTIGETEEILSFSDKNGIITLKTKELILDEDADLYIAGDDDYEQYYEYLFYSDSCQLFSLKSSFKADKKEDIPYLSVKVIHNIPIPKYATSALNRAARNDGTRTVTAILHSGDEEDQVKTASVVNGDYVIFLVPKGYDSTPYSDPDFTTVAETDPNRDCTVYFRKLPEEDKENDVTDTKKAADEEE